MTEQLEMFEKDVAQAKAKGTAAEQDVVAKLKALSPQKFARVPRKVLDGLTVEQYAEVIAHVSPDDESPEIEVKASKPRRNLLKGAWQTIPHWLRAVFIGVTAGFAVLTAVINSLSVLDWYRFQTPPVRSPVTDDWPPCVRLNQWVDGCAYRPTEEMTWAQLSKHLGLPITYLQTLNRHLPIKTIPAGSRIIVWRERGDVTTGASR